MRTIFTGLTPNAQADDIARNLGLLLQPWRWVRGSDAFELEHEFRGLLGTDYVFSFDSGRTALHSILKAIHHLTPGDEVLQQAYTCVAVPDPIIWAGLKPVYVDIDPQTLNMSPEDLKQKISPRSKVLIIQHTFGVPADLGKLLPIAKQAGLCVIEDCCHALGAKYQGKPVGTFGDAAFFSLGRDKVISATFGGLVTTNNKDLAVNLGHIERSLPYPSGAWVARALWHPVLMAKAKLLYNVLGLGRFIMYMNKKLRLTSPAVYPQERTGGKPPFIGRRLANGLAIAARHQLRKLVNLNIHRQLIADIYKRELTGTEYRMQGFVANSEPIYLRYTLRHPRAAEIIAAAKKQDILLGDWYRQAIAPAGVDYAAIGYDPATCPNAEAAARESFNPPTDIHIKISEAERITDFLKQWK